MIVALASCRGEPLLHPTDALAIRLGASDPVIASEHIRARASRGCAGMAAAIDALDRAALSPRLRTALIDEALAAARPACPATAAAISSSGEAARLARSTLSTDPRAALEALGSGGGPAVRFRRAEILSKLGRRDPAIAELEAGLAGAADPAWRARLVGELIAAGRHREAVAAAAPLDRLHPTRIAALAAAGRAAEVAAAIAAAPIPERLELARAAVAAAADPQKLAVDAATAPLLRAIADRLAGADEPESAAAIYRRAAVLDPNDADLASALGGALAAAGRLDEAVAAWDRARALNPATPSAAIDPIAALATAGRRDQAVRRARSIATAATTAAQLEVASSAAAAAGDPRLALDLAVRARALEPGDGSFAFLVARRLDQVGQPDRAVALLAELLRCGARGRPWHRHEVAAEIARIARRRPAAARAALDRPRCQPPEPDDFESVSAELRRRL